MYIRCIYSITVHAFTECLGCARHCDGLCMYVNNSVQWECGGCVRVRLAAITAKSPYFNGFTGKSLFAVPIKCQTGPDPGFFPSCGSTLPWGVGVIDAQLRAGKEPE